MAKEVSTVEKEQKKQQKRFTIVYILGLVAFIIMMIILEGNIFNNKELHLNAKLLKSPDILNIDNNKKQGNELNDMYNSYSIFLKEIKDLKLEELDETEFEYSDDKFRYVDTNYTYLALDNSLELTRKGEEVFSYYIEEDISKVKLISDKTYYLEFSLNEISFKVNDRTYLINIINNEYVVTSNYDMDSYIVTNEIYDKEWNFINLDLKIIDLEYKGYFFKNIEGYTLSDDRLEIIDENNNRIPSTDYLDDNKTIKYTVIKYEFNDKTTSDVFVVNSSIEFPLK